MMLKAIHPACPTGLDLQIQSFRTPDDITIIQSWTGVATSCLDCLYESMAGADFLESIMVWQHDQPILEADICKAVFDELSSVYMTHPGDFTIRPQFPDNADETLLQQALQLCIKYAFEKKGAKRVIIPVYEKNSPPIPSTGGELWVIHINNDKRGG
jgi:hypothetical protein